MIACMQRVLACAERPARFTQAEDKPGVKRARRYLVERFNESVTLAELAQVAGMSRFHLIRQFSKQTGLSPHAFQVHVRIERARMLLRNGFLPVEVAMLVGFSDQAHLTRHFKRIWGITPGAYAALG